MPGFIKTLTWLLLAALLCIIGLLLLLVSAKPIAPKSKHPVQKSTFPNASSLSPGSFKIAEKTLAKALHSYLNQQGMSNQIQVLITPKQVNLKMTLGTKPPFLFLNFDITLKTYEKRLKLASVKVGSLTLPSAIIEKALLWLTKKEPTADMVSMFYKYPVQLGNGFLAINVSSPQLHSEAILQTLKNSRLIPYCRATSQWSQMTKEQELSSYLRFLFQRAYNQASLKNAVRENKALLQVAAAYVNGQNPCQLFGIQEPYTTPKKKTLQIYHRHDLAQHFILAAAIAATGNQSLAKALGTYKELMDFNTGSGFSFSDLAADKAGATFGALAVKSLLTARRLQRIMRKARSAEIFMPKTKGLPDHLSRNLFENRFGGLKGKGYSRMELLIERRIQACPLYRALRNGRDGRI